MNSHRKIERFNGQKEIVLPQTISESAFTSRAFHGISVTDIGYYPRAKHHHCQREGGCDQSILIYCNDGEGWIETGEEKIIVEKDHFIIIPAGTPHIYGSSEQHPWSIYWMHFNGTLSEEFESLLTLEYTRIYGSITFSEERIKLFERMYCVIESGCNTDNLAYVNMCAVHFLSSFCYPDVFLLPQRREHKDVIEKVVDYMNHNLHRPLQLHEMASQVHISVSYFSILFKRKTGYSPLDYFNHIKIQKARQYLQFTDMHVKEIACNLGFDDPYYFSRLFNNMMSVSPAEYRNRKNCSANPFFSFTD